MKTMALSHTRIAVSLAVNVKVQEDRGENLFSFPLVSLTPLVFWVLSMWQSTTVFYFDLWSLGQAVVSMTDSVVVTCLPFVWVGCIVVKSLAWGLGLRL